MTDFQKGQVVTVARSAHYARAYDRWYDDHVEKGTNGTVVKVYRNVIRVSFDHIDYVLAIPRADLEARNGETYTPVPKPVARKLGETPEGMIAPDDPRIAWIFEDAAKLASRLSFCGEYDQLAAKLGIPGRMRDISVNTTINGISISAVVKARTEKEAEQKLLDTLAKA